MSGAAVQKAHTAPPLRLEDFFDGASTAWGIFQDRFGTVRQQFRVDVHGDWDAARGHLHLREDFTYTTGRTEQRVWEVEKLGDDHYRGHTQGVVGHADIRRTGSTVNLRYRMRVPIGSQTWTLAFDDWMFRQDTGVVINRAEVRKFGLLIGAATICFHKAM